MYNYDIIQICGICNTLIYRRKTSILFQTCLNTIDKIVLKAIYASVLRSIRSSGGLGASEPTIRSDLLYTADWGAQVQSFGVSHGSVLLPIRYCLYTKHVFDIIQLFGLLHHSYADERSISQLKIKILLPINCLL